MSGALDPLKRSKRARTAQVRLRCPWLYAEDRVRPMPGDSALLTRSQLQAIATAVKRARRQGRLSVEDAKTELAAIEKGLDIIEKGPLRDVGAYFPLDGCIEPRQDRSGDRRRKNKAARQARKAARPKKKRRR